MTSISSSSSSPILSRPTSNIFNSEKEKEEVMANTRRIWPQEELSTLTKERIRHFDEDLQPRLNHVESELGKIGAMIKELATTIFEVKNADTAFFDRVTEMEGRIKKMLEPSEEYQNLQSQLKKDMIAIIATISSVAIIILGAIVVAAILL